MRRRGVQTSRDEGSPPPLEESFVMRASQFFNPRRAAAVVVLPGILAGMLTVTAAAPASAATAPAATGTVCTGVVNQHAHRGIVQENLLRAAAKRNSDAVAKLQGERTAL